MGVQPSSVRSAEALAAAVAAFEAHQAALSAELDLLDERDRAIVTAIRAGARLEEAAEAAVISRAAVSKAARRTLPSRPGRGGPYSRRRGSSAALRQLAAAARSLAFARERTREAKAQRDEEIANAVANGAGVSETAGAIGMTPASVSVIARSDYKRKAANASVGAVASHTR
jgi:DNA-binding NarL/FixJ family response regulator